MSMRAAWCLGVNFACACIAGKGDAPDDQRGVSPLPCNGGATATLPVGGTKCRTTGNRARRRPQMGAMGRRARSAVLGPRSLRVPPGSPQRRRTRQARTRGQVQRRAGLVPSRPCSSSHARRVTGMTPSAPVSRLFEPWAASTPSGWTTRKTERLSKMGRSLGTMSSCSYPRAVTCSALLSRPPSSASSAEVEGWVGVHSATYTE